MVKVIIGDSLIVETIYYVVYLGYINPFSLPIFPVSHLADQTFHQIINTNKGCTGKSKRNRNTHMYPEKTTDLPLATFITICGISEYI
jgi:hypothetical protein